MKCCYRSGGSTAVDSALLNHPILDKSHGRPGCTGIRLLVFSVLSLFPGGSDTRAGHLNWRDQDPSCRCTRRLVRDVRRDAVFCRRQSRSIWSTPDCRLGVWYLRHRRRVVVRQGPGAVDDNRCHGPDRYGLRSGVARHLADFCPAFRSSSVRHHDFLVCRCWKPWQRHWCSTHGQCS